jgi:hypothetical protein
MKSSRRTRKLTASRPAGTFQFQQNRHWAAMRWSAKLAPPPYAAAALLNPNCLRASAKGILVLGLDRAANNFINALF